MPVDYIVLAIPVFFLLIGLELLVTRLLEKDYYSFEDSISDLSCGILQQVLELFVKTALFAGYVFIYGRFRLATLSEASAAVWVACFLGVDFVYYWFHRLSHEVNAFWAAHVVHHQSEEYNLSVALRQGALQGWFSWAFYLPLALLGFPPLMFLAVSSFNTLYQFWIHTRVIGRLGPLEWILSTPSNHRVHHGRNPKYIDRNHGGTLIVWDRLFGTYQAEDEEVAYGITTPLRSWNPVWANVHYWVELAGKARRTSRFVDKLKLFLMPPGWHPAELGGFQQAPPIDPAHRTYRTPAPLGLSLYIFVQFTAALLGTSAFLFSGGGSDPLLRGAVGLLIVLTVVCLSGLFEGKSWALPLEVLRLAGLVPLGTAALRPAAPALLAASLLAALAATSLFWLLRSRPGAAPAAAPQSPIAG